MAALAHAALVQCSDLPLAQSYWPLDEESGRTVNDWGSAANTGTLAHGYNWLPNGKCQSALYLDGGYVSYASNPTVADFSLMLWFRFHRRPDPVPSKARWAMLSNYVGTSGDRVHYGLDVANCDGGTSAEVYFFTDNGATWRKVFGSGVNVDDGQ